MAQAPAATPTPARSQEPPSLSPQLSRQAPTPWRYKALLAAGLVVLAMVIVAFTTGAWNQAPAIPLDSPDDAAAARVAAPLPEAAPAALPDAPTTTPRAGIVTEAPTTAAPQPAPAPTRTPARPTREVAGDPRAACAGRSEFALYRCMQQQCANPRWSGHARCVRLREKDLVD